MDLSEIFNDIYYVFIDGDYYVIKKDHIEYDIEKSRCNTYDKLLGWINQLLGKNWISTEIINQFIHIVIYDNENMKINYKM